MQISEAKLVFTNTEDFHFEFSYCTCRRI